MKKTKEKTTPMNYRFEIRDGVSFELQLPCPIEKLTKKDRNKIFKKSKELIDSVYLKSKIEAKCRYDALINEAEKVKQDFDL